MFKRAVVAVLLTSISSLSLAEDIQPSPELIKFSAYVSAVARTLTHNKPLVVNNEWKKNEEVIAYKKFTPIKRAAGIFALFKLQDDFDKVSLPQLATNADQQKISLFTRRNTFIQYADILGDTVQDAVAKEFLYGEIADLTDVVTGKSTVDAYKINSSARQDRVIVLLNNTSFITDVIKLEEENKGSGKTVATLGKKAYLIGLNQSCRTGISFCLKALGR